MLNYHSQSHKWAQFAIRITFTESKYTSTILIIINSKLRGLPLLNQVISTQFHNRTIIENEANLKFDKRQSTYSLRVFDDQSHSVPIYTITHECLINMITNIEIVNTKEFV